MPTRNDIFTVVVLYDEWGFDETTGPRAREVILRLRPDFFEYNTPTGFTIYLRGRNRKKTEAVVSALETYLKQAPLERSGIGVSGGPMTFQCTLFGKIISSPLGDVINKAHRNAHDSAGQKA